MTQNMKLACVQEDNIYCVFNENEITNFSTEMLSAAYWQAQSAVTGSAQGRGTTWFVKYNDKNNAGDKHWVLRHYYRGGLIGKIIKDSYFFISQKRTRAAREFSLLKYMQKLSLPAPQPIAYRVTRHGLFYRADLLSSRIENAQDLVAMLTEKSLSDDLWFAIGKTIKQFHDQGIYHHDLNAHNILIDDNNKVWLIDFDQGEQRIVDQRWQQSNMQRLLRSFHKEHKNLTTFHWLECHWEKLIEGYNQ